ncbi:branched-chain-amino-acid transaminase [Candidatus Leptofilum sp.]|uniref:branched-chain-amino-acid transaminase n=1 Tax=Candidatus Leptofilum sp. TaxID=3241576 RepID=UPI003B5ADB46
MNIGTGSSERQVYVGGEYVPENEARISVFDHVVLYGDAVFDTACAWGGRVFKLDEHVNRLFESAHALKIEIPLDKEGVREVVLEIMRRNRLENAYIKILVTRGVGRMPLMSPYNCTPNLIAFAIPYISLIDSNVQQEGIRAGISSMRRIPSECLDSKIKCTNYLNHILMRMEANEAGLDEAIELDIHGYVAEAPGYNVFAAKNGILYTPGENILVGVTRQTVIELAAEEGMKTEEAKLTAFDLYNADEVFLTSTAGGIFAVREIDGRMIGRGKPGSIVQMLNQKYVELLESGKQSTPVYS